MAAHQRCFNTSRSAWAMACMVTGVISVCQIPMFLGPFLIEYLGKPGADNDGNVGFFKSIFIRIRVLHRPTKK